MAVTARRRKGKLKLGHHMIDGLREVLEEICGWPETASCTPGRIRNTGRTRPGPFLTVQARTPAGLKTAAHASGAVQEVFIVTADPDRVEAKIRAASWGR